MFKKKNKFLKSKKNVFEIVKILLLILIFLNSSFLVYLERNRISSGLTNLYTKIFYSSKSLAVSSYQKNGYPQKLKDRIISKKILNGGYILFFRHAERYKAEPFQPVQSYDAFELNNNIQAENSYFSKFVCLNSEGKIQAKLIGDVFKDLRVPVGKVISSPSCRARQTANLAFGKIDVIHNTLVHYFPWFEDDKDFFVNVKEILKRYKPQNKKNIIITAHNTVMGEDVFDKIIPKNLKFRLQEGGFYVIKNNDGKLTLVHKFESFFNFTGSLYIRPLDK